MVRELRFAHWEALEPLPRMEAASGSGSTGESSGAGGAGSLQSRNSLWEALLPPPAHAAGLRQGRPPAAPDLAAGLLHQKLQMLDCCIWLRRHPGAAYVASPPVRMDSSMPGAQSAADRSAAGNSVDAPFVRSLSEALLRESGLSDMDAEPRSADGRPPPRGVAAPRQGAASVGTPRDSSAQSGSETTAAARSALETPDTGSEDFASCRDEEEGEDAGAAADEAGLPDQAWRDEELARAGLLFPALRLRLPPLATSDMMAEREAALAALGARAHAFCMRLIWHMHACMHAPLPCPASAACSCVTQPCREAGGEGHA
jgi:hypothetical protein